jgi:adenylate kinase family enzyme
MKRVLVIGSSGSGKSTFATELGQKTGLPVIHLDREFWQPGWIETPRDKWSERIRQLIAGDAWIIDGTYDRTLDIRLPRADTVIFLDFPRFTCMRRMIKRVIFNYGKVRPDMGPDCPERLDFSFFKWVWNYRRDHYPRIYDCLEKYFSGGTLITFRNPSEVQRFLRDFNGHEDL